MSLEFSFKLPRVVKVWAFGTPGETARDSEQFDVFWLRIALQLLVLLLLFVFL